MISNPNIDTGSTIFAMQNIPLKVFTEAHLLMAWINIWINFTIYASLEKGKPMKKNTEYEKVPTDETLNFVFSLTSGYMAQSTLH